MATDNHKFIITWCDAVTGEEETREANEQEIQELLDAGYEQNSLAEEAPAVEEPAVEETPVVDEPSEGDLP